MIIKITKNPESPFWENRESNSTKDEEGQMIEMFSDLSLALQMAVHHIEKDRATNTEEKENK